MSQNLKYNGKSYLKNCLLKAQTILYFSSYMSSVDFISQSLMCPEWKNKAIWFSFAEQTNSWKLCFDLIVVCFKTSPQFFQTVSSRSPIVRNWFGFPSNECRDVGVRGSKVTSWIAEFDSKSKIHNFSRPKTTIWSESAEAKSKIPDDSHRKNLYKKKTSQTR